MLPYTPRILVAIALPVTSKSLFKLHLASTGNSNHQRTEDSSALPVTKLFSASLPADPDIVLPMAHLPRHSPAIQSDTGSQPPSYPIAFLKVRSDLA